MKQRLFLLHSVCFTLLVIMLFVMPATVQGKDSSLYPVRIYRNEVPVQNVTPEDLKLFVNNIPRKITEIRKVRRSLQPENRDTGQARTILLIGSLIEFNDGARKVLDHLLDRITARNDRLVLIAGAGIFIFDDLHHPGAARLLISEIFRNAAQIKKQSAESDLKHIEESLAQLRKETAKNSGTDAEYYSGKIHRHYFMKYFKSALQKFGKDLDNYIRRHLLPDAGILRKAAALPGNKNTGRWMIHLNQVPPAPGLSKTNRTMIARMIRNLSSRDWTEVWMDEMDYAGQLRTIMKGIDDSLNFTNMTDTGEITGLLYAHDFPFTSIHFSSSSDLKRSDAGPVTAVHQIKSRLEGVSRTSGGIFIDYSSTPSSLGSLHTLTDSYLSLHYTPSDQSASGKIRIELTDPELKACYPPILSADDPIQDRETPSRENGIIRIDDARFNQGTFHLSISGFSRPGAGKNGEGSVKVRILVLDPQNKTILNSSKVLVPDRDKMSISLNLYRFKSRVKYIVAEVTCIRTGISRVRIVQ